MTARPIQNCGKCGLCLSETDNLTVVHPVTLIDQELRAY